MMTPITRIEHYLAKMNGEDVQIPAPITRKELYLAKICGEDVEVPEPVTIDEKFLFALAGGEVNLPKPITRLQHAMAIRLGIDDTEIIPITREEYFWLADGGPSATVKGFAPLTLLNALAKKIRRLTQYGKCTVSGTDITCNNGVVRYGATGKNLLNRTGGSLPYSALGVTVTESEGVYTVTVSGASGYPYAKIATLHGISAGTYTLSCKKSSVFTGRNFLFRITNRSVQPVVTYTDTFTVSDDITSDLSVELAFTGSDLPDGVYTVEDCQLELGSTVSPYEPYTEGFYTEGTPEEIKVTASGADDQTATASNLFAVGSVADEQDIISGTITRRCEAVVSDGTTPSGRYIGTVGEGNILVCAKETGYSGAIASFTADKAEPLSGLVAEINPVQDLHGYDAPWPAGGGVNKLDANYTESITLSKTFNFTTPLPAGDYVLSFVDSDTASTVASYQLGWYKDTSASFSYYAVSPSQKKQVIHATEPCSKIVLYSNKAYNESSGFTTVFTGLQLQSGETATAWTPYSNLCPISGWTGLQGQRTGTQQWDEVWEEGGIKSSDGQDNYSTSSWRTKNYIPIKPETSYFISSPTAEGQYIRARFYDINKNYIGYANGSGTKKTGTAFTTSIGAYYMRFAPQISSIPNHDISINYPSTDTSYHAYTGEAISVSFGRTVYGGSDEVVSGNGTSTMGMVDLGSLTWTKENNHFYSEVISNAKPAANNTIPANILSSAYKNVGAYYVTQEVTNCTIGLNNSKRLYVYDSAYTDAAAFKTAMSGVMLCYELETPQTFTHEGQAVSTVVGQNNIWVDTGNVTAYVSDFTTEKVAGQSLSTTEGTNTVFVTSNVDPVELEVKYAGGEEP